MLSTIVSPKTSQVKPQTPSRQAMLEQRLTHAIATRNTREIITIDGQRFTIEYRHGVGGGRNYYAIRTVKTTSETVDAVSKREASILKSLGKSIPTTIRPFAKPIESGAVLEIELGTSSAMASKVVPVAGWAKEVESYIAKVCKEFGWAYQNPRQKAFEERVTMLRGDQSYID